MTDAPEQIWAWEYGRSVGEPQGMGEWYFKDTGLDGDETQYVRADLLEAERARADRLEEALREVYRQLDSLEKLVKALLQSDRAALGDEVGT